MLYTAKLKRIIRINKSHLIVGLDTDVKKIPEFFLKFRNPILQFNKLIIDSTKELVAGYKFNMAFYESIGSTGYDALKIL